MTLALALAHTTKPRLFNGLFYATCATVIPVLFLALAVQGNFFRQLISATIQYEANMGQNADQRGVRAAAREYVSMWKAVIPVAVAALIVFYATASEFFALWALYNQPAGRSWAQLPVALGTVFLVGAVALQPASELVTWARTEIREGWELRRKASAAAAERPPQEGGATAAHQEQTRPQQASPPRKTDAGLKRKQQK